MKSIQKLRDIARDFTVKLPKANTFANAPILTDTGSRSEAFLNIGKQDERSQNQASNAPDAPKKQTKQPILPPANTKKPTASSRTTPAAPVARPSPPAKPVVNPAMRSTVAPPNKANSQSMRQSTPVKPPTPKATKNTVIAPPATKKEVLAAKSTPPTVTPPAPLKKPSSATHLVSPMAVPASLLNRRNTRHNQEAEPDTEPELHLASTDQKQQVAPVKIPKSVQQRAESLKKQAVIEDQKREAFIDLSATRSLTNLMCSLAINPGLGAEVSVQERRENISLVIRKAHELAEIIGKKIKKGNPVPNYLHGVLLQETSKHIAHQWKSNSDIEAHTAKLIASELFNSDSPLFSDDVYQNFSQKDRYQLDGPERENLEISSSIMHGLMLLRSTVLSMDISGFIHGSDEFAESLRSEYRGKIFTFTFDDESKIVNDLMAAALRIAEKNKLDVDDLNFNSQWNCNMIYRAVDLIKSEYQMFIDRLMRVSFSDFNLCEQELNNNRLTYESALEVIENRAENSFNLVLKTAKHLMAQSTYLNDLAEASNQERIPEENTNSYNEGR